MANFQKVGKGIVKRTERRSIGIFIDGVNLDRATRRLNRKVDLSSLIRGVSGGLTPVVARYYTLIPNEDDSRQWAFLDAVHRAGLDVIIKRLPPKTVTRLVTIDIEMAADMVAFARGHDSFSAESVYLPDDKRELLESFHESNRKEVSQESPDEVAPPTKRVVTVVCPSRDLSYPIGLVKELGADTVSADFSEFAGKDVLKSAAKWIDLSDSDSIWRE